MPAAPLFLDVDWDFLPGSPPAVGDVKWTDPDTGRTHRVPEDCYRPPAEPCERKGDFERGRAWNRLIRGAADYGLDLPGMYETGSPGPDRVFSALAGRYDLAAPLTVSDSHAHALDVLRACAPAGGARVVHFDAHHDLGYSPVGLADDAYRVSHGGMVSCESWLYWAMTDGLVADLVIVYPDWQTRDSGEGRPTGLLSDEHAGRVHTTTYAGWLADTAEQGGETCGVFLARSGWWSPPWLDEDFCAFTRQLLDAGAVLDAEQDDALTPRRHRPLASRPVAA